MKVLTMLENNKKKTTRVPWVEPLKKHRKKQPPAGAVALFPQGQSYSPHSPTTRVDGTPCNSSTKLEYLGNNRTSWTPSRTWHSTQLGYFPTFWVLGVFWFGMFKTMVPKAAVWRWPTFCTFRVMYYFREGTQKIFLWPTIDHVDQTEGPAHPSWPGVMRGIGRLGIIVDWPFSTVARWRLL